MEALEERSLLTVAFPFVDGFGSPGNRVTISAIATDSSNNIYITGGFSGIASFGGTALTSGGDANAFVAKLDSSGHVLWALRMGSSTPGTGATDAGDGITVDPSGDVYVTGLFTGTGTFGSTTIAGSGAQDAFVAKLDASTGNVTWAKSFGGSGNDFGQAIKADASGNVYFTGAFTGSVTFGNNAFTSAGGFDVFVAKLDSNGNVVWAQRDGGAGNYDQGFGLALDGIGGVEVTGNYQGQATFGTIGLNSTAGTLDIFVARLDAGSGNVTWARSFGGDGVDVGTAVAADSSGNVYLTGSFQGTVAFGGTSLTSAGSDDVVVAKLDSSGNVVWADQAGGFAADQGFGIALDGSGNVYVTGLFSQGATFFPQNLYSVGTNNVFVAEYDNGGHIQDSERFGDAGSDIGYQVAVDGAGRVDIVGKYEGGSGDFGDKSLPAQGTAFLGQFQRTATQGEVSYDFDKTGHSELSVYRDATSQWFIGAPQGGYGFNFGAPYLYDIPVPGDYDGVGHAEGAVYRPDTQTWFVGDANGGHSTQFGQPGDIPVPGDYDGVGHTEYAVFRPSTSQWLIMGPNGVETSSFGAPNLFDIPVPGDYEGLGRTQMAVFRPSTAQWFVSDSSGGKTFSFGTPNLVDIPVPGDYDGVGHTEFAVFHKATAEWFVAGPTGGHSYNFGAPNFYDIPLESPIASLVRLGVLTVGSSQSSFSSAMVQSAPVTSPLYVALAPQDSSDPAVKAKQKATDSAIAALVSAS